MSEIRVNSIRGVSGSAAAITVGTDSCSVKLNSRQGRNLVVNGGCLIAQRGTSSALTGCRTVDRFRTETSGTDEEPTQEQADGVSGTPAFLSGLRKCFKVTNGNQTSGADPTNQLSIVYKIEAQDIRNSGWNYISPTSFITLSFWIKSSVAQNFTGRLATKDGTVQNYPFETGSLSANTWTMITKKISGNANLQFDDNTDNGLSIAINAFLGTDLTGSVTLNTWAATVATTLTPDVPSTWYTTDNATLEITGLQLELGEVASDFQQRSFSEELALCQRYYHNIKADDDKHIAIGFAAGTGFCLFLTYFPVPMRAIPTYTGSATFARFYGQDQGANFNLSDLTFTSSDNDNPAPRMGTLFISTTSGMTAGQGGSLSLNADNGVLEFSAEI